MQAAADCWRMFRKNLLFLRYPAIVALSVLACACRNDATSLGFAEEAGQPGVSVNAAGAAPVSDQLNRMAKQGFQKPERAPEVMEAGLVPVKMVKKGSTIQTEPPLAPLRHTKTKLIEFENGPFPYHGAMPSTERPFLDVSEDGRRGHRTSGGNVYWEDKTYNDRRTLLHIPRGFDVRRPALMVVFLHGHGAILQRDVIDRQRVPEQVSESGVNAVLVAPQLAVDAADSSAGKLWQAGGFQRYLQETSDELVKLHGDPRSKQAFDAMPIVIVAYSGGYMTAASCIRHGGAGERVRGVVLLDALYGDIDTFASWISSRQKAFFLSAFANSTRGHNSELQETLKGRGVPFNTALKGQLKGTVSFISTAPETEHRDFVTNAWANHPVKDLLQRLKVEAR
jgi:pimeloyl-ACP methyl ester carboxylesterase